ncbi:MAG: 1-phosphofructokinase [Butyrivibrio sp.]|nr:1-phosphofructokinase [Acetatifactor muris]MCM1559032.1 1-phosphofructokinase [Butyrivibrio sp.]
MVYTVTFNPAIDYFVRIEELKAGSINRSQSEELFFGGKGINVSVVLAELGVPSRALGFVAGFTGRAIRDGVSAMGIETDFVELEEGCSRINVKISSGVETEINGQGPGIPAEAVNRLYEKLDALQAGDTLVLAGSIPDTLPDDIYERILARLCHRNVRTAVDATGELLLKVLKYRPFLVKPNRQELGDLFGVSLHTEEEIIFYGKQLRELGAGNVLISMAGDGALLLDERGGIHRCGACMGEVKNSVGAGDSMVAGFIAGFDRGGREYALKLGTAAGGATAFSRGLAKKDKIFELLKQL